jgi:Meckelin (Transmembrane protein 67)
VGGDSGSLARAISELALCEGVALTAVALVLSVHSFVLFKGQKASFMYVLPNDELEAFRTTIIVGVVGLTWALLNMIYAQTQTLDIAMVDWERPQQVRLLRTHQIRWSLTGCRPSRSSNRE